MAMEAEPSSSLARIQQTSLSNDENTVKPLMVRIKRKRLQPPIEALWLEVSERPSKRLEAELLSFSLNESNTSIDAPDKAGESQSSRLLFHHLDTVTSFGSEETTRVNSLLRDFCNEAGKERHRMWVKSKHGKVSMTSKDKHEELASKARFEQVWRSRKGSAKQDNLSEVFHLYDIVRVDLESNITEKHNREMELAENRLLHDFLPLFKEYLPAVAAEVESSSSMASSAMKQEARADEYVYDVYALGDAALGCEADALHYPMIRVVDEEDFRWGSSSEAEYDSDDSNDENNPVNDYPEEDEDEDTELSSDAGTEDDDSVSGSRRYKRRVVQSDASEEYNKELLEESEDGWNSAEYEE